MPQLDSLGLRENPFSNNTDPRFFYADQNRAQILESTEHLIEYSSNLQVIIGASGLGKTHLLDTLASRTGNNWRVAEIKDVEQYDTLSLIQAILNSFAVPHDDDMELLESLETQLAEIIQLGFRPILFIDNAQTLSQDAIRFLLQLSQQKQNDEPYINIVLFATMDITEKLQGSDLQEFRDVIHIATLSSLNKEGVSGYLRHKMAVAGFDRESPFTPRIIDSIYSDSNGVPEKINFFANKFLVSSGKGDNYIDPEEKRLTEENSEQEDNLMDNLKDDEFKNERTDRAEEQIHRLTEQFDEIEKLSEEPADNHLMDQEFTDKEYADKALFAEQLDEQPPFDDYDDKDSKAFALPKIIIPVAIIGIILAALMVINTVFDDAERVGQEQVESKQVELLPLELPLEKSSSSIEDPLLEDKAPLPENALHSESATTASELAPSEITQSPDSESVTTEPLLPETENIERTTTPPEILPGQAIQAEAIDTPEPEKPGISVMVPELKMVDPEPVIGSNKRQTITVLGHHLGKDITLVVTWAENTKEFSAKQTPEQWLYIDESKISLRLNTGIHPQVWQIYAKNDAGKQSKTIQFEVVKPFIAEMAIKSISPNPLIGSDKRQTVTINGQGFSKQTVVELKWDKNSKHFSARLSPNQFEYISANEIKLFITTGTKERKWKVIAKNPDNNTTSLSSFTVLTKTDITASVSEYNTLKDKSWLSQQPDGNYTIQLFGSYNKQVIDKLISEYALTDNAAWFETQRNGRNWYSMVYGSFKSKEAANKAVSTLDSKLTNPKPWVRSLASIKKQLNFASTATTEKTNNQQAGQDGTRNESWIWTQNPSDYTVQLLALSKEKAVQDYAKKHQLESKSVYFKMTRNNKPLYVLLYGNYSDKKAAQQARDQLAAKLKGSKPWVRNFSDVHSLMGP